MSNKRFKLHHKGFQLNDEGADASDNIAGSFWYRNGFLKGYLEAAVRTFVTTDQTQTLSGKTLTAPVIETITTNSQTLSLPDITGSDTLASLGLAQTFSAAKTFTLAPVLSSGTLTNANGGTFTLTLPGYAATLATLAGSETLTNKTLTTPAIESITTNGQTLSLPDITGADTLMSLGLAQTVTAAKTYAAGMLVTDYLKTVTSSRTLTLPTSGNDTLVGKATTDVLTNKTLTGNIAVNLVSGAATVTLPTTTCTLPGLSLDNAWTGSENTFGTGASANGTIYVKRTTGTSVTISNTKDHIQLLLAETTAGPTYTNKWGIYTNGYLGFYDTVNGRLSYTFANTGVATLGYSGCTGTHVLNGNVSVVAGTISSLTNVKAASTALSFDTSADAAMGGVSSHVWTLGSDTTASAHQIVGTTTGSIAEFKNNKNVGNDEICLANFYAYNAAGTSTRCGSIQGIASNQTIWLMSRSGTSNYTVIGGSNNGTTCTPYFDYTAGSSGKLATTASAANLFVATDGQIKRSTSSRRYKSNITDIDNRIDHNKLYDLKTVEFQALKPEEDENRVHVGFIAEEVDLIEPYLVQKATQPDGSQTIESINYQSVFSMAVECIKDLRKEIDILKQKVELLESK